MLLLLSILSFSCFNDEERSDKICKKLEEILKENAISYIEARRKEIINEPLFINAVIEKDDDEKDYYECILYLSTILFEEESVLIPCTFMEYDYKGRNVVYFFDKNISKEAINKDLYQTMKTRGLIKSQYKIEIAEGAFMVNTIEAWNLFICKNDINTRQVIKSNYILEEKEKPQNMCD